jgi:hypothetical protein
MSDSVTVNERVWLFSTKGELNHSSKLLAQDVINIRKEYAKGLLTQTQLAIIFNVSTGTINQIVRRRTWKHLKR